MSTTRPGDCPGCDWPLTLRFWSSVDVTDGCWLWTGKVFRRYGKAENGAAHRVAWAMFNGPILSGMHVCHRCDTPLCVRPDHLFLGTHEDNMRDRDAKGRNVALRGEAHVRAKLTAGDVRAIRARRAAGESVVSITKDYPVCRKAIYMAIDGTNWASVKEGL